MNEQNAYNYYMERAAIERNLARAARDKSLAETHLEAAVRYENLAKKVALEEDLSGDPHC